MSLYLELTDGVISLRPMQMQFAQQVYEAARESIPEIKPWMSWAHDHYSLQETEKFLGMTVAGWEEKTNFGFAIFDAKTDAVLGGCGLNHIHPVYHFCNLGYWVRTSRHGEGVAGRAARLAAKFGFEQGIIIRAEIVMAVGNEKSRRAAEKTGAHYEGILRNRMVVGKNIFDAHMFSLIPEDFGITTPR